MKHLETVLESGLLSEISKAEWLVAFESLGITSEKLKKDEAIFVSGEKVDYICLIERGCVREEKVYSDGEVCIIHTYLENQMFALETTVSRKKTAAADYVCNEDSTIVYIPYKNIEKSKWVKEMHSVLLRELADDNFRNMYKIEILARKGVRDRILLYLKHLKKRFGSNVVSVRMNREQLAQFLCVNRSTLSNELNQLKREKVIDFKKNEFVLLDQEE